MDPSDDDAGLMLRYRDGDAAAFAALYAHYKGPLYRYLLRHVRSASAAADLFQEVWSHLIATRARYEPRAKFATFLFHIAHNCAIDFFRRDMNLRRALPHDAESLAGSQKSPRISARPDGRIRRAAIRGARGRRGASAGTARGISAARGNRIEHRGDRAHDRRAGRNRQKPFALCGSKIEEIAAAHAGAASTAASNEMPDDSKCPTNSTTICAAAATCRVSTSASPRPRRLKRSILGA